MRSKAFVVAPVFLLLGVLGMKFGWKSNPELDWSLALSLWTAAHVAYLVGYAALGVVLVTLWVWGRDSARSGVERTAVHGLAVVGTVGLLATVGQMVIDLLVGFEANARSEMSAIFDRYQALPGFETFFYGLVPALGLTAISVLLLWLAVRRQVLVWPALLFLAGAVAIGTRSTAAMVVGGVAVGVALIAVIRQDTVVRPGGPDRRPGTVGAHG